MLLVCASIFALENSSVASRSGQPYTTKALGLMIRPAAPKHARRRSMIVPLGVALERLELEAQTATCRVRDAAVRPV